MVLFSFFSFPEPIKMKMCLGFEVLMAITKYYNKHGEEDFKSLVNGHCTLLGVEKSLLRQRYIQLGSASGLLPRPPERWRHPGVLSDIWIFSFL